MPISANTAPLLVSSFKRAISNHYGDNVLTLDAFKRKRRATFKDKLLIEVDAKSWGEKIAEAEKVRATKNGVVTRLNNEQERQRIEMRERHARQMEELKAKQNIESSKLTAEYEPRLIDARAEAQTAQDDLNNLHRASYFAALDEEDDGRRIYGVKTIEDAVNERVDRFMEVSLQDDEEGRAVEKRMSEEQIVTDAILFAKDIPSLRTMILLYISQGKVPAITIEAWGIENGVDVWVNN